MRRRSSKNAHLADNLYPHHRGGYRYKDPRTKRWEYWNVPLAEAQKRARERNQLLPSKRSGSVSRVIADYLDYLEKESGNKASTLDIKRDILGFYSRTFHGFHLRSMTRGVFAKHWETIGVHGWQKHRTIWIDLYRWAIAHGIVETNEAEATLKPKRLDRKRTRHTEEGYAAVYTAAPEWMQIAMDLAVASLQDRSTICAAKRMDVAGGRWVMTRSKTGARLAIKIAPGSRLEAAIRRALAYPVTGHYLLRKAPDRRRGGKVEATQVLPGYLTSEFRKVRDASGAYDDLEPEQRPAFHDLRAYGSWLYEKAGYPTEYVQALMAHESKKTTQFYQEGHEVKYIDVEAGL
jgi:enterobacteria phage integrase